MSTIPSDNLPFLFAAFAVVWVVFFIYAGYMSWRRRSVQQELEDLRESGAPENALNESAADDGDGHPG